MRGGREREERDSERRQKRGRDSERIGRDRA